MSGFYQASQDQLPKVVHTENLEPSRLAFKRWTGRRTLTAVRLWLFATPSLQIVAAITFDTPRRIRSTIDLLEDCYYLDVTTDTGSFENYLRALAQRLGLIGETDGQLPPERHQIAFSPPLPQRNSEDLIQRVIYRQDLPYRREFSSINYPAELNRRPGNTVAIGPYVSAICGHQNDVENCALLSAVQAVASQARLREIWQEAYHAVASFRSVKHARTTPLRSRRRTMEDLADKLTQLELDLSHSVEASAHLGSLIPSLRVVSYHTALFESMAMARHAEVATHMLERLEKGIQSELTSIQSTERRSDDDRRDRWAFAAGFLASSIAPIVVVLSFFGMNIREVRGDLSMFDPTYNVVYLATTLVLALGALSWLFLYLQQRWRNRSDRS